MSVVLVINFRARDDMSLLLRMYVHGRWRVWWLIVVRLTAGVSASGSGKQSGWVANWMFCGAVHVASGAAARCGRVR